MSTLRAIVNRMRRFSPLRSLRWRHFLVAQAALFLMIAIGLLLLIPRSRLTADCIAHTSDYSNYDVIHSNCGEICIFIEQQTVPLEVHRWQYYVLPSMSSDEAFQVSTSHWVPIKYGHRFASGGPYITAVFVADWAIALVAAICSMFSWISFRRLSPERK